MCSPILHFQIRAYRHLFDGILPILFSRCKITPILIFCTSCQNLLKNSTAKGGNGGFLHLLSLSTVLQTTCCVTQWTVEIKFSKLSHQIQLSWLGILKLRSITEPSYSNERIGRLCYIPIIIQVRAAAKHTLPLLPLLPFFSFFPCVSEQNGGPKKALNPQIRGTEGVQSFK